MIEQLRATVAAMTQEQLISAMYRDPLTCAYNRAAYDRMMFLAVAIVDLDSLKYVNDTYGHRAGDSKLRELSDVLRAVFGDDRVFRLSGDEFAVIGEHLPEINSKLSSLQRKLRFFSYGVGVSLEIADERGLIENKTQREREGKRAARGEKPAWR